LSADLPTQKRGSLLLELLVAISVLAVILSVGSEAVFVSLQSSKISGQRDIATGLASEMLESVRAVSDEKWQNLYNLTKSTHYYPTQSAGKWTLTTAGDETIVLSTGTFTRYVVIEDVSRNQSTRAIETTYSSVNDDPSTQKVTATVSWAGADPFVVSEYFFRWRNQTCAQTGWTGNGNSGTNVVTCADNTYDVADTGVSTTTGTLRLQ